MPSFAAAFAAGADGVECDVHLSADGQLVVCHDPTLTRTTDRDGEIADLTVAEIRAADAGARHPQFAGTGVTIPLLDELLDLIVEHPDRSINIEVKHAGSDLATGAETAIRTAQRIVTRGLLERVVISSFDASALAAVLASHPEVGCALLVMPGADLDAVLRRHPGLAGVHPPVAAFRGDDAAATIATAQALTGGWVGVWTVNDPDDAAHVSAAGVDVIIGDDPAMLRGVVGPRPA